MKKLLCGVAGCLFLLSASAQQPVKKPAVTPVPAVNYTAIPDSVTGSSASMAAWLVSHCENKTAMLRSLYAWMSSHINYDVVNTFQPGYYKDTADAISKTLQTRTAVCEGYASLYVDVARRAGIPAMVVTGYPLVNGRPDNASHAWVAVQPDSEWKMIDPTWGSGSVNNNKYTPRLTWRHFLVEPHEYLKTHVPFDPLFQFSEYPLRHDEIRDGKWSGGTDQPVFVFRDTLAAFNKMSALAKSENMAARIGRFGVTNQLISAELTFLTNQLTVERQNASIMEQNRVADQINECSRLYNRLTNIFNDYVNFRNKQFTPARPDQEIREWVDGMSRQSDEVEKKARQLTVKDPGNRRVLREVLEANTQLKQRITDEQAFVAKYIKTGKMFRKSLFYKVGF
ncbi:Transglutaminase-like superfamily protein [Chitinophaga eiseniae]|uniref:Transglutaminase-like superfamily protein n=1 Tax=Chitinophaga eiseniae TaxID=634771 RepID=A0A1T4KYK3_9BACT|nr:transglutaminase domain-containing protein [Chitinophaga eiseniae]SJZ47509.1 Transglutaminase-like superfamily protein [Chitinophaga eiseniae]